MVVNPAMPLPNGYIAVNMSKLEWSYSPLSSRRYFNVTSEKLGYDISAIDADSVRCGKYQYVGLVGDADIKPEMDMEMSIYRNLAGVRVIDHRYTSPSDFIAELGDSCYMIFKLK